MIVKEFKQKYMSLKSEGKTDREIAKIFLMSLGTVKRYKKIFGIRVERAPRKNYLGITQEQLSIAEKNGIDRHIALQRVRQCRWSIEDAISIPLVPLEKRTKKHEFK